MMVRMLYMTVRLMSTSMLSRPWRKIAIAIVTGSTIEAAASQPALAVRSRKPDALEPPEGSSRDGRMTAVIQAQTMSTPPYMNHLSCCCWTASDRQPKRYTCAARALSGNAMYNSDPASPYRVCDTWSGNGMRSSDQATQGSMIARLQLG